MKKAIFILERNVYIGDDMPAQRRSKIGGFIARNVRKIAAARKLEKNRLERAFAVHPERRFSPTEYNDLQARLNANGERVGAREFLAEGEALSRRVSQMDKNKARGKGRRSPYKLSGIRK